MKSRLDRPGNPFLLQDQTEFEYQKAIMELNKNLLDAQILWDQYILTFDCHRGEVEMLLWHNHAKSLASDAMENVFNDERHLYVSHGVDHAPANVKAIAGVMQEVMSKLKMSHSQKAAEELEKVVKHLEKLNYEGPVDWRHPGHTGGVVINAMHDAGFTYFELFRLAYCRLYPAADDEQKLHYLFTIHALLERWREAIDDRPHHQNQSEMDNLAGIIKHNVAKYLVDLDGWDGCVLLLAAHLCEPPIYICDPSLPSFCMRLVRPN